MLNQNVSFALTKSFRIGVEAGIGLDALSWRRRSYKYDEVVTKTDWYTDFGPYVLAGYALTLSYDF
ncbi:hypothetical protein [Taibaiella sp. KBW10]|uniref:hypothetical protein n=1 Tax=Taibaiella sp. KBW10 TaxID=2153357 RepID=UPI000F5B0B39|nr:hypothetical protein [Taibaiella sp. KBW10]